MQTTQSPNWCNMLDHRGVLVLTWNLLSQDVFIQSNENICITVCQFPQPQVYVTLAEELIGHINPICGGKTKHS